MRCYNVAVVVMLIFSSAMLAQHSSAGNAGSSGGSSGSGSSGGGSHGSSLSAGGTSGMGHSSGGSSGGGFRSSSSSVSGTSGPAHSSNGGSASHGSSARSASFVTATLRPGARGNQSYTSNTIFVPSRGTHPKTTQPEKRSFLSFLRHASRKPESKPDPDLRYRICWRGPCKACPPGQVQVGGACGGTVVANNSYNYCSHGEIWSGGTCLLGTRFLDDCNGFRLALDQQAQRMQAADSSQQRACSAGATQDCSELTGKMQSETNLYRSLQERYRQCQLRSYSAFPNGNYGYARQWPTWLFDAQYFGVDYR
jgi:hypothetical protein